MNKLQKLREAEEDPEQHGALGGKIDQLERIKDVKNHFYSSGFEAWPGENPDLKIYEIARSIVGARWVRSFSLIHCLHNLLINLQTANPSIRNVIYGFFNLAPRRNVAMDISFGTSTSYSLILARAFSNVCNNLILTYSLSDVF